MKTLASKTAKSRQLVTIDVVRRHEAVVEEINKMNKSKMSILDVGGRINSLSSFIDKEHSLVVLNTNLSDLQVEYPPAKGILGSGCNIPFKNNSFDVVTSIACLEHIPKKERLQYLSELKRIAKQKVIIYVPIGEKAEEYDKKLYRLSTNDHIKKMTGEHISCGLPRVEQVKDVFPFCKIKPLHNVNVWLITLTIQGIPRLRRLSWLIYNNILKWFDNTPPFYAIVLSWDKSYYSSETKLRSSEINSHYNMMSVNSSKETSPVMNMVEDGLFLVLILFRTTFIFLKKIKSIKNALKKLF